MQGGHSMSAPEDSIELASIAQWAKWLDANHTRATGVYLILAKKSTGAGLDYQEILETALCYGWIDAIRKSHTEKTFLQRFTPRGKRSIWSKINRDKATALIGSGRMLPTGLAEVERAKHDGRWDRAYDRQGAAEVPEDLAAAFKKNKKAKAFFETLDSRNRYAVLFRLQTALKAETRARRLATFVEMLANEQRLYP